MKTSLTLIPALIEKLLIYSTAQVSETRIAKIKIMITFR